MALTYVGGKTVAIAGTTSTTAISLTDLTGGVASAPATEDIVIVGYGVGSSADEAPGVTTSGYTEEQELYSDSSDDTNLSVSWKIMGGSPDTSVTVSGTGNVANAGVVAIQVWRGLDTATPFDVAEMTATGTGDDRPNPPAITPVSTGAIVLAIGAGAQGSAAVFTSGDLSNFITNTSAGTKDCAIGMGSIAWTSGAVNPAQFGGGAGAGASRSWAAVSLALRPSPYIAVSGTSAGVASVNGASAAIVPRTGTGAGATTVAGASAGVVGQTGAAAGVASVSGASAAVASASGSSVGAATVTAVSFGLGVFGTVQGAATVSGESRAIASIVGSSAGAASVAGVGRSIAGVAGTASGSGAASGAAQSVASALGVSAGAAAVAAEARALWPVTGAIAGVAIVLGEGEHSILALAPADRIVFLEHDSSNELTLEHDGSNVAFLTHDAANVVYL